MKTGNGVRHYKSHSDYLQNRGKKLISPAKGGSGDLPVEKAPTDKVELSQTSKDQSKDLGSKVKENLKQNERELKSASKHLLKDAVGVAKNAVNMPGIGTAIDLVSSVIPESEAIEEVKEVFVDKEEAGQIEGAKVIFVSGLHLAGISSNDEGLEGMAKDLEGASHFSWKDEEVVIDQIKRTPKDEPIILIGHSLGGDAIVNIANNLNTFANGFRKIDLLVTLDSVGFDNDIIPKNVKKNINFIGDKDAFFNDGPNIARDNSKTEVINNLRKEGHTQIDDSREVRETIWGEISRIRESYEQEKEQTNLMKSFLSKILAHPNALEILK
ncbi:lipase family protein [Halobacteriovorax marinus]|nr:alpha/beta hydrolase [Halobacteriovorax marinus]